MRQVYMDHAATTYVKPQVFEAMRPYFTETFGNPSSLHSFGREAASAVERAREQVAGAIGAASPQEICFTAGGSESDNDFEGHCRSIRQKGQPYHHHQH